MDPINFGGQRSKVKVTIDIHVNGNKRVNTKETKPLCISSSNLAEMLIIQLKLHHWGIFEMLNWMHSADDPFRDQVKKFVKL